MTEPDGDTTNDPPAATTEPPDPLTAARAVFITGYIAGQAAAGAPINRADAETEWERQLAMWRDARAAGKEVP